MNYYIIIYKNTFDAMEAERIFNEKGFKFKIMPTPTSITQSCGICTRFEIEEEGEINSIIKDEIVTYKNVFRKNGNGFVQIK